MIIPLIVLLSIYGTSINAYSCQSEFETSITENDIPNEEIQMICQTVANNYENVSQSLLLSLVWTESRGIVTENLTQIMGKGCWHKEGIEAIGADDYTEPSQNIEICAWYLNKWIAESGSVEQALVWWNEGTNSKNATSRYAKTIVDRSKEYFNYIVTKEDMEINKYSTIRGQINGFNSQRE